MKKLLLISLVFLTVAIGANAQTRVGGMIGYGSDIKQWGLGANAEFLFNNEKMSIAPKVLFFFPEKSGGIKYAFWELNGDFHYYLVVDGPVEFYGLAGLNLTTVKTKAASSTIEGYDNSNSDLGVNLGLGFNIDAGSVMPYAEAKYVAGKANQAVISLGLKIPFGE
jgi:hypothetical protein